jgi:hypothetical protein
MFLLLIIFFIVVANVDGSDGTRNSATDCSERADRFETSLVDDEYIVTLHGSRRMQAEQHRLLSSLLGVATPETWQPIERRNLASTFPTDFALVKVGRVVARVE